MDLIQLLPTKTNNNKSIKLSAKQINRIGILPKLSPFLNIQHLHISHNQICNLDGIQQFQQLKSLSLSNNLITNIQELKKVIQTLKYLTIHSNPLTVYDYNDICFDYFPKLKRLDGMCIEINIIKQQRIYSDQVSRWLIPWLQTLKMNIESIQKALNLRNVTKELNQSTQLKLISQDAFLNINWQDINTSLQLLNQPTLINLAKIVNQFEYPQELNKDQILSLKKTHYDTFIDLIKLQAYNHFTSFIDFIQQQTEEGESDYYKTFLNIQKPQFHISQDLYSNEEDVMFETEPIKIQQYIPSFLRDKIKCTNIISNTYRKQKKIQPYERIKFYQYFPVFPFRQEYIQSIVQLAVQQLNQLKNLIIQIGTLYQSAPSTIRTIRRKPNKVQKDIPTTQQLTIKPIQLESPHEEVKQNNEEQIKTIRPYNELKNEILQQQHISKLTMILRNIFFRRIARYFSRIYNQDQENTKFYDYPQILYQQLIFNAFKKQVQKQKLKRQKFWNKRLLRITFLAMKKYKYYKKKEQKQINKGYQILQKLYFKNLIDGLRTIKKQIIKDEITKKQTINFQLILKDNPFQKYDTIKFKNYNDENKQNQKICSVCNYEF